MLLKKVPKKVKQKDWPLHFLHHKITFNKEHFRQEYFKDFGCKVYLSVAPISTFTSFWFLKKDQLLLYRKLFNYYILPLWAKSSSFRHHKVQESNWSLCIAVRERLNREIEKTTMEGRTKLSTCSNPAKQAFLMALSVKDIYRLKIPQ